MSKQNLEKYPLRLPPALKRLLEQRAEQDRRSLNSLIIIACEQLLKQST